MAAWIKKIRRGMIIRYYDGKIYTVIGTGHIGKSCTHLEQKGSYFIMCKERIIFGLDWDNIPPIEILGFADKKDMRRINRITNLVKKDNLKHNKK